MIPPVDLDQLFAWYAPILAKGGNNLLTVPFVCCLVGMIP
jgi:hypothetical protein